MDLYELLKELSETPGPSGYEARVANLVKNCWEPLVDHVNIDRIGSVIAIKNGQGIEPRPRILLAAHLDEIGLIVRQIVRYPEDETGYGYLRVTNVGGVDIRQLNAQTVVVHSSAGQDLTGIIGALPVRLFPTSYQNKPYGFDDLVVDVGMTFEELKEIVSVGDFVSFRQPLRKLLNKHASGKALDNRASIAAVTICLEYLSGRQHVWDVITVATAQEETRLLGAFTSGYAQKPDVAIAIDVTWGKGPGANEELTFVLNDGPTIGLGPSVHPGIYQALQDTAEAIEMKVHVEPFARPGGTDAFGLQVVREGVPTGLVSIPLRYMHTMVETLSMADVERTGRLLSEFIIRLDNRFLEKIAKVLMGD